MSVSRSFRRTPRQWAILSTRLAKAGDQYCHQGFYRWPPPATAAAHDLLMLAIGPAHDWHTVSLLHA